MVVEDISSFLPPALTASSGIAFQVYHPKFVELFGEHLSETVKPTAVNKGAVTHERDDPVFIDSVTSPSEKANIHIVKLCLLSVASVKISVLDALIDLRVFAVLVVFVFVELVGVVGRVADDDADALGVLVADALDVDVADRAEEVVHVALVLPQAVGVVEGVDEAEIGEFLVVAGDGGV